MYGPKLVKLIIFAVLCVSLNDGWVLHVVIKQQHFLKKSCLCYRTDNGCSIAQAYLWEFWQYWQKVCGV